MKNRFIILLTLALLSLLSGILISKMSFIGKVGITFFYDEYTIFKSWWKTSLFFLGIQSVIYLILSLVQFKTLSKVRFYGFPILFLLIGFLGLYFTYIDFTETSHRLMKSSFHFGFYLFWIAWFINCISFLKNKMNRKIIVQSLDTNENDEKNA